MDHSVRLIDSLSDLEHVVMIVPVDAEIEKAQKISRNSVGEGPERRHIRTAGRLDVEDHDRDQDRDDDIAERFETLFMLADQFGRRAQGALACDT